MDQKSREETSYYLTRSTKEKKSLYLLAYLPQTINIEKKDQLFT